jgi:hypothetical protein
MTYQICYTSAYIENNLTSYYDEIELEDRFDAERYVEDNLSILQRFSVPDATRVMCYIAEIGSNGKPQAILYKHKDHGMIWLELE